MVRIHLENLHDFLHFLRRKSLLMAFLMTTDTKSIDTKSFKADVSQFSTSWSIRSIRIATSSCASLISNAADACEKLRYEAIERPDLLGDDAKPCITIRADADNKRLTVEDNGIGMGRDEMGVKGAGRP